MEGDMKFDIDSFVARFCEDWLDEKYEISRSKIDNKGWSCMLAPDFINAMEAEWLADAILSHVDDAVVGISFEYEGIGEACFLDINMESILEYIVKNNHRYVILTSFKEGFVFYKDQFNRFFMVCGLEDFVSDAYKCSYDTAKIMYFDWLEDSFNNQEERSYLERVWSKYMS